ncbi:Anaphase-promoting complex subunit 5 [Spathaspora sp. JA1]|nr:Anaphase-promoting complex subunit 5 [Spathaspora sp. JA1]
MNLQITEDLTPHKLGLLFVLHLYSTAQESISSQCLTLLIHLLNNDLLLYNDDNQEPIVFPTLKDLCDTVVQACTGANQESGDVSGLQLALLDLIWKVRTLDDLNEFIDGNIIPLIATNNTIYIDKTIGFKQFEKSSILGSFIHKVTTEFKLLKFNHCLTLFDGFVKYRESTRELYLSMGGTIIDVLQNDYELFGKLIEQSYLGNVDFTTDKGGAGKEITSVSDLSIILNKQIELLESKGISPSELLDNILNSSSIPNLPSYYYINYLESLKKYDYNSSFESLYRYFDYMVSNNSKYFYHFALILKANLHQYYNQHELAMNSIQEAISIARENKDNSTLTYIISWLFNYIKNKPELAQDMANPNQLLEFLIMKTKTVSLSLYSLSFDFKTFQILNHGDGIAAYLNNLTKATYISIYDEFQISSFIRSMEMGVIVWNKIGNNQLSQVYNDIAIEFTNNSNDLISLKIRLNFLRFLQGDVESSYNELQALKQTVATTDYSLFNSIQVRSLIMLIRINLFKGKFIQAKEIVNTLLDNDLQDLELNHEFIQLQIEIEIYLENYNLALKLIEGNIHRSNIYLMIKLNLLKCTIFNKSNNHIKSFSLIIQTIQLSQKCGYTNLLMESLIIYINMLNHLGYYQDIFDIFENIMPALISLNNLHLTSRAYFELANGYFNKYKNKQKTTSFNNVLKFLNKSINGFSRCNDLISVKSGFEFEMEIAEYSQNLELLEHAKENLLRINHLIS